MIGVLLIAMVTLLPGVTSQDGSVLVKGDILLGGLVPVHSQNSNLFCGELNERLGIQRLEAILFAVDQVNSNNTILPNISLGLKVYDTCSSETIALDRALHFVKDKAIPRDNHPAGDTVVAGVVGPSFSSISVQVAHLFRLFQIPQVSFDSTSYELSDKTRFEFFSRTVPHDLYQAKALVDIAKFMNWIYISVVYSGDSYGTLGFQALVKEAKLAGVCIAVAEKIELSRPDEMFASTINKFLEESDTTVVVVFSSQERQIRSLLQAAKEKGLSGKVQWLGTDSWGNVLWLKGLEEMALNAITVSPKMVQLEAFKDYFVKLQPKSNSRNPWFKEFWEYHFNCTIENDSECSKLKLSHGNNPVDTRVASTVDAVFVFAHALDALHKQHCPHSAGICQSMRNVSGKELLQFIRNVSFVGASGNHVHFNAEGDVAGRYDVLMFKKKDGDYKTVFLGEWNEELKVRLRDVSAFRQVESSCRPSCKRNEVKVPDVGKESCCWSCQLCDGNSYLLNDSFCAQCPLGYWPTPAGRKCTQIEVVYFGVDWKFSLPAIGLAAFGALATAFVIAVLIKYQSTPLVKACGRELSYLLLIGILLAFAMTFVTAFKPRNVSCIARFFGNGVVFTICYASLFIKTNRISRIFNRKNLARRPMLILPHTQLGLVAGVVSVQLLLLLMLALLHTPRAQLFHPEISTSYLDCSTSDLDFGLSQVYNFILICVCTVYAFKTRKIPSNFNEAKYIAFAMYSSCIVWLAFLAVYYMEEEHERKPLVLCVSESLIAFVLLGCLYGPKVYVILFRPHRNVHRHVNPSLSLSSLSKEKGLKSAYVAVKANADNEDEEQAGSSAEGTTDKKRMSFDSGPQMTAIFRETGQVDIPNNKYEMEKLIIHLRNELLSTKKSLLRTQDQLRQRTPNRTVLGEVENSHVPQGNETLPRADDASLWKTSNNCGLAVYKDLRSGDEQEKESLDESQPGPCNILALKEDLDQLELGDSSIHRCRKWKGSLNDLTGLKMQNVSREKLELPGAKRKLITSTSCPKSSDRVLHPCVSLVSKGTDRNTAGSSDWVNGLESNKVDNPTKYEEQNQCEKNAKGTLSEEEVLRLNGKLESESSKSEERKQVERETSQKLHKCDSDNRIICTAL